MAQDGGCCGIGDEPSVLYNAGNFLEILRSIELVSRLP